jgi:4-amino-4-deoxy-L-arabinose transferase-like glycosyltransferase
MSRCLDAQWNVFLMLVVLAIAIRFFSFFPSVIDHDESTYLEIARELNNGKILYVDLIDIKPPGVFLIFALIQKVFGYSIFVFRLVMSLWIAVTAFMVCKTVWLLVSDRRAAIAGGIIYILFVSVWTFYGVSVNTEIVFNLATITTLYLMIRFPGKWGFLSGGLIMGIGFIVKYMVLSDFAAFLIFILIGNLKQTGDRLSANLVLRMILAGTGFLIPFALVNIYFLTTGHYQAFSEIAFHATQRYPSEFDGLKMIGFVGEFVLRFLPVSFFYFYTLFDKSLRSDEINKLKRLTIIWTLFVIIAVVLPGNSFNHYMIQLMLPVSIAAAAFFHSSRPLPDFLAKITSNKAGKYILFIFILVLMVLGWRDYYDKKDWPREVAGYLAPRLKERDVIYTGNYQHIVYYLLKKDSPTPYVHRSLLYSTRHIKALGIDPDKEFQKIMDQSPVYILMLEEVKNKLFNEFIEQHYTIETTLNNNIRIYRRNSD